MTKQAKGILSIVGLFIVGLIIAWSLMGCSGAPIKRDVPDHRKPSSNAKVHTPKNGWSIKRESDIPSGYGKVSTKSGVIIWDLEGAILDGKNQKGNCDQDEKQEPLFRAQVPFYLKNGFVRDAKNALTFYGPDSGVEKVTWLNICEDAVSTGGDKALNFTLKNNEFIGGDSKNDKAIQLNQAKGAVITGNTIYGVVTGMRLGDNETTQVSDVVKVGNNKFISVRTAYHPSRITVQEISSSDYDGVSQEWHFANGAKKK